MPQGRRKTPFSGKQKREQLRDKKDVKRGRDESGSRSKSRSRGSRDPSAAPAVEEKKELTPEAICRINAQPDAKDRDANRYALHFFRESDVELDLRKKEASHKMTFLKPQDLEVKSSDYFPPNELGFPKRPDWDFKMGTKTIEVKERAAFRDYLDQIEQHFGSLTNLSHFELNLETWRQLWRVIEMSDIILCVTDIRHPVFHFPPSMYSYVVGQLNKRIIIILNKCDLVPPEVIVAWMETLEQKYPDVRVIPFASYSGQKLKEGEKKKRIGTLKMATRSCKQLFNVVSEIVSTSADITSWIKKIEQEEKEMLHLVSVGGDSLHPIHDKPEGGEEDIPTATIQKHVDQKYEKYRDGIVSIGLIGHPNVGKSSLLNAIMGRKVVSVSRTPGHTKYFQTIFITPVVKLVDCPGLVFPSLIPKAMQVLMGCFPIAQLREPYSAIKYMAERIDLPTILNMKHADNETSWSAYDICEGWAVKRGFITAKAGRPDVYRAANDLLRKALDGRTLCLTFYPENYFDQQAKWKAHPTIPFIQSLQFESLDQKKMILASDEEDDTEDNDEVEADAEEEEPEASVPVARSSRPNKYALLGED